MTADLLASEGRAAGSNPVTVASDVRPAGPIDVSVQRASYLAQGIRPRSSGRNVGKRLPPKLPIQPGSLNVNGDAACWCSPGVGRRFGDALGTSVELGEDLGRILVFLVE